ncbi:hypothetical protein JMA_43150 (plasmid) [Jeotgalibacillus malaysiensis]|uniref:Uncharacterized protein n=1 Tax=Jeotgalibacillus malaysiensis TaxID=1508404 RepID=A0A0B5AY71_9BACL|nr:M23 family metallopeptidase [Jeotgalibacillus malaysiensis]AJD93632.1 hypothetical protein JMA_43150 [Jeotgalibacillus malaysiensis]
MKKSSIIWLFSGLLITQAVAPTSAFAEANSSDKKSVVKNVENKGFSEEIKKKRDALLRLDKEILSLEAEIKELNQSLKKEKELEKKKVELQEKEELLIERWEGFSNRLADWQIKGNPDMQFLEVLFGSKSFSDMISRAYTFQTLMTAEQEQIEQLQEATNELEKEKDELEKEVEELKQQKKLVEEKQEDVNAKRKKMENELKSLEKKEFERIQKELKEQEERKKRLLEEQVTNEQFNELRSLTKELGADMNSHFIRPATGRLTSPYGMRPNPFGGSGTEFHTGIDIANPIGTPIMATADGEVIKTVHSNQGYGNYIVLKHIINGKVFHSLYSHLSMVGVNVGENVKQGEVVGLMGSTGRSTGSHLHFEIQDENRQHMNPDLLLDKGEKKEKKEKKDDDDKASKDKKSKKSGS